MRVNSIINNFVSFNAKKFVSKNEQCHYSQTKNDLSCDVLDLSYGVPVDKCNTIPVKNDALWISDSTIGVMNKLAFEAEKVLEDVKLKQETGSIIGYKYEKKLDSKYVGTRYEYDDNGALKRSVDFISGVPRIITQYMKNGAANRVFSYDEKGTVERIELLNVDDHSSTTKLWLYENGKPSKYYPCCTFDKNGKEQGEHYIFKDNRPYAYVGSLISFEF